jgi:hypothetical protein
MGWGCLGGEEGAQPMAILQIDGYDLKNDF